MYAYKQTNKKSIFATGLLLSLQHTTIHSTCTTLYFTTQKTPPSISSLYNFMIFQSFEQLTTSFPDKHSS